MEISENEIDLIIKSEDNCHIIEKTEIPDIDLYMDQVTTFMETKLFGYKRSLKDKIMTKTMINNYAKAKLFPAPIKKKYTRNHIMLLIIIYHLKNMLSINDIARLMAPINEELEHNPGSKLVEHIYENFTSMQKKAIDVIKDDEEYGHAFFKNEIQFSSKNQEVMQKIMYVLGLSIFSSLEKRISEKIIDSEL
jgi:DNA-binding transcriptional MerR regulator